MPRLVQAPQRSQAWFEERRPLITASDFDKVMAGKSTAKYQDFITRKAVEIITGIVEETPKSKEMEWGEEYEETAWLTYSLQTGEEIEDTGLWVDDSIQAGASPDKLVGADSVGESKCPKTTTHLKTLKTMKVPSQYKPQTQGQLMITERNRGVFISFDPRLPENAQLAIVNFERDEEYIAQLRERIIEARKDIEAQIQLIREYKG